MRLAIKMIVTVVVLVGMMASPVRAADDVVSAIHGTITKLDAATKTAVVKTEDGTEHTMLDILSFSLPALNSKGKTRIVVLAC